MNGKASRGRRSVRAAGYDDAVPEKPLAIVSEKILPPPWRIFLREPANEVQSPLLHAVGLRDIHGVAEVFSGGGFEANISQVLVVIGRGLPGELAEPAVGVMDLDGM